MKFFIIFFMSLAAISGYLGYRNSLHTYATVSPIPTSYPNTNTQKNVLAAAATATPFVTPRATPFATPTPSLTPTLPPIYVEPPIEEPMNQSTLGETIEKSLRNTSSTYGVYVKNLRTGEYYGVNETRNFEPASLYKLWVMAKTYEAIQNGELKESDILSQSIARLNSEFGISPELAELTEGSITLTVENALTRMITVSDNYAAYLLSEKLTNSAIQQYLIEHGFMLSTLGDPPQTTPLEIARFLEQLYSEKLTTHEYTQKMISLLKKQQLNGKMPKYIPTTISIAHKTGELGYFSHDAGIIYGHKGDYLIVAMSEGTNPDGSAERIAIVSKAIFDYFETK